MTDLNEKAVGDTTAVPSDPERGGRRGSVTIDGRRMSRIAPPAKGEVLDEDSSDEQARLTAALLFSEYICLAIMSFPYSYSVLGLVPGLILTAVTAGFVLYTSLIVWEFCLRHPEVRDVCDIGQMLFWNWRPAWYITAVMFLLNNTFIQGLHVVVIERYLNTMTGHPLATVSAFFTFVSVILAAAFAGAEGKHGTAGYTAVPTHTTADGTLVPGGEPLVLAIPLAGTSFVAAMEAYLNIAYTFIGQITLPSFIAEMRNPYDFRKALWAVTICEIILFSLVGGIVYGYTGTQYNTAPAFGSLGNDVYKKVSFSFMIPTLIFLGVLYASVSARFLFFRIFEGTRHKSEHTLVGWASWAGILAATWILAFIIAEVIPFFSDLLALMSSLFDSFFGWIFWGLAYIRMRAADHGPSFYANRGIRGWVGVVVNVFIIGVGLLFLGAGTYVSVQSIIDSYNNNAVGSAFSCADNAV
ncbi:hypothetical protein DV736_g2401, partial [Chaetothyriales sp. CBS 134916]